jgi:hypothetical protein
MAPLLSVPGGEKNCTCTIFFQQIDVRERRDWSGLVNNVCRRSSGVNNVCRSSGLVSSGLVWLIKFAGVRDLSVTFSSLSPVRIYM